MTLSPVERELIELLRSGKPFGVTIMSMADGQWMASTTEPPFTEVQTRVGLDMSLDEAWRGRRAFAAVGRA